MGYIEEVKESKYIEQEIKSCMYLDDVELRAIQYYEIVSEKTNYEKYFKAIESIDLNGLLALKRLLAILSLENISVKSSEKIEIDDDAQDILKKLKGEI